MARVMIEGSSFARDESRVVAAVARSSPTRPGQRASVSRTRATATCGRCKISACVEPQHAVAEMRLGDAEHAARGNRGHSGSLAACDLRVKPWSRTATRCHRRAVEAFTSKEEQMQQNPANPFGSGWRAKLGTETRERICRRCKALSAWGRIVRLAKSANQGSWHRGPPEQAGKQWPSGAGPSAQKLGLEASVAAWQNVRRGFMHTITIADANLLEYFDEDHRTGAFHENQFEVWKNQASSHPGRTYPEFLREEVGRGQGVTYMPTPNHRPEDYAIRFLRGRLVLPNKFPLDVKRDVIAHSYQKIDEDDVARGQPKGEGLKHRVIFVADDHNIYIAIKKVGTIQHSSFLAGRPALISGYLTLRDYRSSDNSFMITKIKGKSGHYRPDLDQFVVFLWAIELLVNLDNVIGSYAVVTSGVKDMIKRNAAELLNENRGRLIPANAPDDLRFQLELGDEPPVPTPPFPRLPAPPPGEAEELAGPVDEETPLIGAHPRRRYCGCCQCVMM